ncbi:hypothetical protein [Actinomadura sp. 3N407]|uniref:hypothetical protein n=1 Tax=Actinomadura sp. 3N407 TaxID=3457423 RepID=UPI003FCD2D28
MASQAEKVALYAAIRRDSAAGLSGRALEHKHGVSRRTVAKALASVWPEPRKKLPPRKTRLDAYRPLIDQMLRADLDAPRKQRHTVKRIFDRLVDEHDATQVTYRMPGTTTSCYPRSPPTPTPTGQSCSNFSANSKPNSTPQATGPMRPPSHLPAALSSQPAKSYNWQLCRAPQHVCVKASRPASPNARLGQLQTVATIRANLQTNRSETVPREQNAPLADPGLGAAGPVVGSLSHRRGPVTGVHEVRRWAQASTAGWPTFRSASSRKQGSRGTGLRGRSVA